MTSQAHALVPILLAFYAVNTFINCLRGLQQEALLLIKIQLCNSNFRFQSLTKAKTDQVKKKQKFFLTTCKNSKAKCWRNRRGPNVQLHIQEIALQGLDLIWTNKELNSEILILRSLKRSLLQLAVNSKKLLLVLFLEYPNFCLLSIGFDWSNFYMNKTKQTYCTTL